MQEPLNSDVMAAAAAAGAPLGASASGGVAGGAVRATRFMMEGVGARVIRGADWKWGKQV